MFLSITDDGTFDIKSQAAREVLDFEGDAFLVNFAPASKTVKKRGTSRRPKVADLSLRETNAARLVHTEKACRNFMKDNSFR